LRITPEVLGMLIIKSHQLDSLLKKKKKEKEKVSIIQMIKEKMIEIIDIHTAICWWTRTSLNLSGGTCPDTFPWRKFSSITTLIASIGSPRMPSAKDWIGNLLSELLVPKEHAKAKSPAP
jgi:Ethanolamine utilization protein EutJ (predicted chaperonin)